MPEVQKTPFKGSSGYGAFTKYIGKNAYYAGPVESKITTYKNSPVKTYHSKYHAPEIHFVIAPP